MNDEQLRMRGRLAGVIEALDEVAGLRLRAEDEHASAEYRRALADAEAHLQATADDVRARTRRIA